MRQTEAGQYLPQRGLNPFDIVECAAGHCDQHMALAKAAAFPANFSGVVKIAFFCSEICYLEAINHTSLPRA